MRNKYDIDKFIITNKGGNVNYFPPFYYLIYNKYSRNRNAYQ